MDSVKGAKAKCAAEPSRPVEPARLDLETVRRELQGKRGPEFWRSLDELAATPEFQELLHREFPRQASEWIEPVAAGTPGTPGTPETPENTAAGTSRRAFLQLSSASLALAGLTACTRQPIEKIVPYVEQPEQVVPGRPLFFATTLLAGGYGVGVLAESHEGRPTKIEGNTEHPASLGSTDMFAQAAILELYDPARSQVVLHDGSAAMLSTFLVAVGELMRAKQASGGQGVRLLTGAATSPTLATQMKDFAARYPNARWHRWEAAGPLQSRAAAVRAFGRPVDVRFDLTHADVIVAFDADFLAAGPGAIPCARQFADRRRVREASPDLGQKMNRLYVVETTPTPTGSIADHRLPLAPAELEALLLALAREVGVAVPGAAPAVAAASAAPGAPAVAAAPAAAGATAGPAAPALGKKAQAWLPVLAADLLAHPGTSLVVAGETTSPAAQVLAHAINEKLGNAGKTAIYAEPAEIDPVDPLQSLGELVRDMRAGQVDVLIMLGGVNPVYTAPADLEFADALGKVKTRIHHGLFLDETAELCHWHLPAAHHLESWGDARAFDGTASLAQPLIEPLYGGKSLHEAMAVLLGRGDVSGYDLVRATWNGHLPGDFEPAWRRALHDGVIPGTQQPPLGAAGVAANAIAQAAAEIAAAAQGARAAQGRLTLCLRPDPTIGDGSWASNVWLQELPKPMTKLTWDNAVLISPATHQRLGLDWEERVRVSVEGRQLDAAVWVLPGQAEDTLTLSLGYGRRRAGENGSGLGFNAYVLRTSRGIWNAPANVQGLGERYTFACTQNHHAIDQEQGIDEDRLAGVEEEKRHIVRTATLAEFQSDPEFVGHLPKGGEAPPRDMTLYPNRRYEGHSWGMAIDLNVCTGCSTCIVACQAENNIPVVGKDQVMRRREMHWIRVDRYFTGDMDDPGLHNQPVPCMQCENAPCELVCPVGATVHSSEGLNDMTYNRCVGTRYCSNNCPYKVRRFNFLRYSDRTSPLAAMMYNPDVTVRMRGVMEKCTYCVQRIEHAKIDAQVTGQPVAEQRLKTACQQACPTQAIVFGDLNAERLGGQPWQVSNWKASSLNYGMLDDLNTRPRTTYLARVTNPNPRLTPNAADAAKVAEAAVAAPLTAPAPAAASPTEERTT
jgi:MoCo/4Fe-4S cofactor protein with predicted Tat translocation signal